MQDSARENLSGLIVETYSSYAYAVEPRGFVAEGKRHVVVSLMRIWRTPGQIHFYLRDDCAEFFELIYDEPRDEWSLREFGKSCPPIL